MPGVQAFLRAGRARPIRGALIPLARPLIGEEEITAVTNVLRSGHLAQGEQVAQFEEEFAAYLAFEDRELHAVAVANGTAALQLALMALGIGPGAEVIVPGLTFIATAGAVHATGANPVFVDVDPGFFTIDPASVEAAITPRTAAVIAVHLYGQPADLGALQPLLDRAGIPLIEDSAQAHGAAIDGRRVGTFGTGCFSFYPTKNMTTGEGGMVTTRDAALADRMRLLRQHGMRGRYEYETFGLNLRMTDIAAALGRVQLGRLEGWNAARRSHAGWLDANLRGVRVPAVRQRVTHAYHLYTVLADDRDALHERLRTAGIGSGVYYPEPIHRTNPYHRSDVTLPVCEELTSKVLSLPVRPDLTAAELDAIAEVVSA